MFDNFFKRIFPGDSIAIRGILWSLASMVVVGTAGITMNVIIAVFGNSEVLGAFNQVMAVYIVLGQIASGGTQYSILYFWSNTETISEMKKVYTSLLCIAAFCGFICSSLLFAGSINILKVTGSESLTLKGLCYIAPALFVFGINKFLLGVLNANRRMRIFSVLQMTRYIVLIVYIVVILVLKKNTVFLFGGYFVSEIIVLLGGCWKVKCFQSICGIDMTDVAAKVGFGFKAMIGGIIGEVNTKIDILTLGLFWDDSVVGYYSFAALMAEGFYLLIIVFRNNLNPVFAKYYSEHNSFKGMKLLCKLKQKMYVVCFSGAATIIIVYLMGCKLLGLDEYIKSVFSIAIILVCLSISAPEIVEGNLLTLSGRPSLDSKITFYAALCNAVLNFMFIPFMKGIGAALATGMSYIFYKSMIRVFFRKMNILSR